MQEKVRFIPEGEGSAADFYVLTQTKLAGSQYLFVTESLEGDGEAMILRAHPETAGTEEQTESMYDVVEDEQELSAVLLMMRDSLEDLGIEVEI